MPDASDAHETSVDELIQVVMDMCTLGEVNRDSGNRNFKQIWYKMRQSGISRTKTLNFESLVPKSSDLKEHQVLLEY